jgi:hypothetical protein
MGTTFFKGLFPIIQQKSFGKRKSLIGKRKSIKNPRNSIYNFKKEFNKQEPLSFSSQKENSVSNSVPNWARNSISSGNYPTYMPESGYADVPVLYQNRNLIPRPNKEKKLKPFFVPPSSNLRPSEPRAPPPPLSPPPNISSLGFNLPVQEKTFSKVKEINQSNSDRNSINIIPLSETKSKARPKSPLLLSGAQKRENKKKT